MWRPCSRAQLVGMVPLVVSSAAIAEPWDYSEAHDQYSLLDRRLVNRQLFEQIEAQPHRVGGRWEHFAAAADLSIGTQQTFDDSLQSRYHGWYIADTFLAARIEPGFEATFNLTALNPSASDGFRVSSQITAALTLHADVKLGRLAGDSVNAELIGLDLGNVTLGNGLLLEQTPIEGVVGMLKWRGLTADILYGGRALWADDDLIAATLTAFDGRVQMTATQWQKSELPTSQVGELNWPDDFPQADPSRYLSISVDQPLPGGFRLAGDYAVRPRDGQFKHAFLLRADYLGPDVDWLSVHTGYQFRYYQQQFGPRDRLWPPTSVFNTPYQENAYVTNPFEFFALSERFEQWSHTTMFEVRLKPIRPVELYGNAELWLRYAAARQEPRWVAYAPDGFRAPGMGANVFYDLGVRYYPWRGAPHRAAAFITNKQVASGELATDPVAYRFDRGFYYVIELEAFL